MEFGKLEDISEVDWKIPQDDPGNESRLRKNQVSSLKLFFGSPAWGSRFWFGKIYPPKTPTEKLLYYYSQNFNAIELNTSHYRIPDEVTTTGWLSQVPETFEFCPKLHKDISHGRFGLGDKTLLKEWLGFISRMQTHLGPCFIQLHEKFSYEDKILLFQFLENWPREFKLSLELRHASWFQDGSILPALVDYLHRRNIGLVMTDVAGRRDVLHGSLSTSWSTIRLIGNNIDPSDETRLKAWAQKLKIWESLGLQKCYLFLHQPDDVMTIEFAQMAQKVFMESGFTNVPEFKIHVERDLFNLGQD